MKHVGVLKSYGGFRCLTNLEDIFENILCYIIMIAFKSNRFDLDCTGVFQNQDLYL